MSNNVVDQCSKELVYYKDCFGNEPHMMVSVYAKNAEIFMCNKIFAERFGYKRSDLIGKSFFDFCLPESLSVVKDVFNEAVESRQMSVAVLKMLHKSSAVVDVLLNATAICDENDEIVFLIRVTLFDLSNMKKAESELKHRIAFEKMIIDISQKFTAALPDEVDGIIASNIEKIGRFTGVDRCCIYIFSMDNGDMENFCFWKKQETMKNPPKVIAKRAMPWLEKMIAIAETVYVPNVDKLPKECDMEKKIWQSQGVKSVLLVPLVYSDQKMGMICFETLTSIKFWDSNDITLLLAIGEMVVGALARKRADEETHISADRLKKTLLQAIQAVAQISETRDPYTAGHQRRVALLVTAIAEELKLSADQIEGIRLAALIHDIGKIYAPAELLSRPGALSENEFNLIKEHPRIGFDIIKEVKFPWSIKEMILCHHERLDGSGYPKGLKGDEICIGCRILAVADVVEAMMSHRPYRPALGLDMALQEIEQNKDKLYDPKVVDACVKLFKEKNFKFD